MTETTPCTSPPLKMGMPGLLAVCRNPLGISGALNGSEAAAQDALHRDASVEVIVMEFRIVKRLILGNFQTGKVPYLHNLVASCGLQRPTLKS